MKNVVFVTIDHLPYESLGCGGNRPTPSPVIDALAEEGLQLTNCFSPSLTTQFASPGYMTSTLPLDYGGYDRGILDRPVTLPEVFQSHGYRTGGFVTAWWYDPMFGYDRGFDDFFGLYSTKQILGSAKANYIDYFSNESPNDKDQLSFAMKFLFPFLQRYFKRLPKYFSEKLIEKEGENFLTSPSLHEQNFKSLRSIFNNELSKFEDDPERYIHRLLSGEKSDLFENFTQNNINNREEQIVPKKLILKLFKTYTKQNYKVALKSKNSKRLTQFLRRCGRRVNFAHQKSTPSAGYVFDNASRWINRIRTEPFFVWIHLFDVHDKGFLSWEYSESRREEDLRKANEFRQKVDRVNEWHGNPISDLSLQYVDNQLGGFRSDLLRDGLLDNTAFVIMADHGGYKQERPYRAERYRLDDFYDERFSVPAIFYNVGVSGDYHGISSSLDIPPTLLEALGLKIPNGFDGKSVIDCEPRSHVFMEHAGSGPCIPQVKPITVAARTPKEKIVFNTIRGTECYDLSTDPEEYGSGNSQPTDIIEAMLYKRLSQLSDSGYQTNIKNSR